MKLKNKIKKLIRNYHTLSLFHKIILVIRGKASVTRIENVTFEGWKMVTGTHTPWLHGGGNFIAQSFAKINNRLIHLVEKKEFVLTQFIPENTIEELNGLSWRHYIVFWSAYYAAQNTASQAKNIAECGVCDGLTSFYAINAIKLLSCSSTAYLYDAWDAMREDLLIESEKGSTGSYSYLNLDNTKTNLSNIDNYIMIFNKGYIPEVFVKSSNPDTLIWLHIDLNSAIPTIDSLNFFWNKIELGGVVLFDDFAWPGYEDTKMQVEEWIKNKNGILLQIPTGQSLFIKQGH
jgi:O-methyltransferase